MWLIISLIRYALLGVPVEKTKETNATMEIVALQREFFAWHPLRIPSIGGPREARVMSMDLISSV
jgi:hypothetical protein